MKRNNLPPCPFCGSKAMIVRSWDTQYGFQVACTNFDCFLHPGGAIYETQAEAAKAFSHWIDIAKDIIKDMEESNDD